MIGLLWNPRLLPFFYLSSLSAHGGRCTRGHHLGDQRRPATLRQPHARRLRGGGRLRRDRRLDTPRCSAGCTKCSRSTARVDRGRNARSTPGAHSAREPRAVAPSPTGGPGTTGSATRAALRTPPITTLITTDGRPRGGPRLRARPLGEQFGQQRVRHHDVADAAAALDRRVCIGSMEGLFFEATASDQLPLPHRSSGLGKLLESGSSASVTPTTTPSSGRGTCVTSASGT